MARLTPLGWTCIGVADVHQKELTSVVQSLTEIETSGSETKSERLRPEEKLAIKVFENSVQFKERRYKVAMPSKPDATELPNNYDVTVT